MAGDTVFKIPGAVNARMISAPNLVDALSLRHIGLIQTGTWQGTKIDTFFGGTNISSYTQGDILYASTSSVLTTLAKNTTATRYISNTGTSNNPAWAQITLTNGVTGILPIANGGTNASSASITAFNNITGYSAAGATGTTSTNLVFSTSPTLITPILGTPTSGALTNCTSIPVNQATGNLPVANLNSGTSASSSTFWRGDGTWATPTASGLAYAYYKGTPTGTLTTGFNTATYPTKVSDSANAYSSGTYTVPTTGVYSVAASFSITGAVIVAGNPCGIQIANNGTGIATQTFRAPIAGSNGAFTSTVAIVAVSLTAGDAITVKGWTAYGTPAYGSLLDASEFMFSIRQLGT